MMKLKHRPGCHCCCESPFLVTASDSCTNGPLAGVRITAAQGLTRVSGVTDAGGLATLTIKGVGSWAVTAELSTYTTGTATVGIICNETATRTFNLSKSTGTTTLTVTAVNNCSSAALPGVAVAATQGKTTVNGTTNAFGTAVLTLPRGGDWSVTTTLTGYGSQTKTVTTTCWTNTTVSFALAQTADNSRITITSRGCNNLALPGAAVTITRGSYTASGTSDSSGVFIWNHAPVGSWTATASKPGFNLGTTSGTLACNANSTGTISMPIATGYHCMGLLCPDPAPDTIHLLDPIIGLVTLTYKATDPDWTAIFGPGAVWSGTGGVSRNNMNTDSGCFGRAAGTWTLYFAIQVSTGNFYVAGWVCWPNSAPSNVAPFNTPFSLGGTASAAQDGRIDPSTGARKPVAPVGCPATGVTYTMPAETFTPGGSAFANGANGLEGVYGSGQRTWMAST